MPQTRKKFWKDKIERNEQRDKEVNCHYKGIDWKVFRIWEHEINRNQVVAIKKVMNIIR